MKDNTHRMFSEKQPIMWNISPLDSGALLITIAYQDNSEQFQTVVTREFAQHLSAMFTNAARQRKKVKK